VVKTHVLSSGPKTEVDFVRSNFVADYYGIWLLYSVHFVILSLLLFFNAVLTFHEVVSCCLVSSSFGVSVSSLLLSRSGLFRSAYRLALGGGVWKFYKCIGRPWHFQNRWKDHRTPIASPENSISHCKASHNRSHRGEERHDLGIDAVNETLTSEMSVFLTRS